MPRYNADEIADAIRQRICLEVGLEPIMLHEGELASEFGVSRTPIRQVLQRLAFEGLAVTRSGVGTIVTPLELCERDRDIQVVREVFRAAANCALPGRVPARTRERLGQAVQLLDMSAPGREPAFRLAQLMLEATVPMVPDRILEAALCSACWRHTRWQMRDSLENAEARWRGLAETVMGAHDILQRNDQQVLMQHLATRV